MAYVSHSNQNHEISTAHISKTCKSIGTTQTGIMFCFANGSISTKNLMLIGHILSKFKNAIIKKVIILDYRSTLRSYEWTM